MVILSVMTKGSELLKAGEDNYTVAKEGYTAPDYGYNKLTYRCKHESMLEKNG